MTDDMKGCGMSWIVDALAGIVSAVAVTLVVLIVWERLGRRDTH